MTGVALPNPQYGRCAPPPAAAPGRCWARLAVADAALQTNPQANHDWQCTGIARRRRSSGSRAQRLFEHRVEYRRDIAGRGIDDLEDFGGRSLLLQRLARLSYQTCILNRDHRLRREVLDQRDLLVGKWSHFSAEQCDEPKESPVLY